MATVLFAVFALAACGAVAWVLIAGRRDDELRPFELGPTVTEAPRQLSFSGGVADPDRPPTVLSALRVAVLVAAFSGLIAALTWGAGAFLKARLDQYLRVP